MDEGPAVSLRFTNLIVVVSTCWFKFHRWAYRSIDSVPWSHRPLRMFICLHHWLGTSTASARTETSWSIKIRDQSWPDAFPPIFFTSVPASLPLSCNLLFCIPSSWIATSKRHKDVEDAKNDRLHLAAWLNTIIHVNEEEPGIFTYLSPTPNFSERSKSWAWAPDSS